MLDDLFGGEIVQYNDSNNKVNRKKYIIYFNEYTVVNI